MGTKHNYKGQIITIAIIAVAAIALVITLISVNANKDNTNTTTTNTEVNQLTEPTSSNESKDAAETAYMEAFVSGCTESGDVSRKACICMWEGLRKDYSVTELATMGSENSDKTVKKLAPYAAQCISEL